MKKVWCFAPQTGGNKISPDKFQAITAQVEAHEKKQVWYPQFRIKIRFKGQFCYLDAFKDGEEPFPIGRLRYFDDLEWSLAFYVYSTEEYRPCLFPDGKEVGKIEDAINVCSFYMCD